MFDDFILPMIAVRTTHRPTHLVAGGELHEFERAARSYLLEGENRAFLRHQSLDQAGSSLLLTVCEFVEYVPGAGGRHVPLLWSGRALSLRIKFIRD